MTSRNATAAELRDALRKAETDHATWSRRAQRLAFRGKTAEAAAATRKADAAAELVNDLQIRSAAD